MGASISSRAVEFLKTNWLVVGLEKNNSEEDKQLENEVRVK